MALLTRKNYTENFVFSSVYVRNHLELFYSEWIYFAYTTGFAKSGNVYGPCARSQYALCQFLVLLLR